MSRGVRQMAVLISEPEAQARRVFRWLVLAEILLSVGAWTAIAVESAWRNAHGLPTPGAADSPLATLTMIYLVPTLILELVSWVGMLAFWPPARRCYTWVFILSFPALLASGVWRPVAAPVSNLLGTYAFLLAGGLLALMYEGRVSKFFSKR